MEFVRIRYYNVQKPKITLKNLYEQFSNINQVNINL